MKMRKSRHQHHPKRAAGTFPSYLYKSLDELEGIWADPEADVTALIRRAHSIHRKPLILVDDDELGVALRQEIGIPWLRALVLIRLAQDPLRSGHAEMPGGLLRNALGIPKQDWGDYLRDITEIANAIIPTLAADNPDWETLFEVYSRFKHAD